MILCSTDIRHCHNDAYKIVFFIPLMNMQTKDITNAIPYCEYGPHVKSLYELRKDNRYMSSKYTVPLY
jgi:hypothetical protein